VQSRYLVTLADEYIGKGLLQPEDGTRINRISRLLFALTLPIAAFANTVDFSHQGGTLAGSNSGLTLTGSTLIFAQGPVDSLTGDLATVTFSTESLSIGSLQLAGVFNSGSATLTSGDVDLNGSGIGLRMSAPEPMSISLFGVGLISIAGLVRYRLNREKEHPHA